MCGKSRHVRSGQSSGTAVGDLGHGMENVFMLWNTYIYGTSYM